jgi:hypothetical protein
VSVMVSNGVAFWIQPVKTISTLEMRPLRNSSMARGTRDRLSVAIARWSISNDGTLFRGGMRKN